MASARSVDLHGLAAGAKGDVELGFAGVYPGNDRGIVCHLRRSCLVYEPWLFRQPSGSDEGGRPRSC
ncbi:MULTISPECIES: hypothetical protein [unclassified Methylobacterium]|uniref:hypothetical protein n=1 Tax=unclassified Methylobacterium TaxID=2615210 RepID=UPI000AA2B586|nr:MULTISPECIES: hypothetical protein [unclassified Methylobacterium]